MVCGPFPGISNSMVSAPEAALATSIASRKVHSVVSHVPVPGSAVELTVKVEAWAGEEAREQHEREDNTYYPRSLS